jgi:hypothetical protein
MERIGQIICARFLKLTLKGAIHLDVRVELRMLSSQKSNISHVLGLTQEGEGTSVFIRALGEPAPMLVPW